MKLFISTLLSLFNLVTYSQADSNFLKQLKALDTANILKLDTSSVPNDPLTRKIKLLRSKKHGISIETIIQIKIMEERQKDMSHPKQFYDDLLAEVTKGRTSKLIENCIINLYRRSFSINEIDELIKFYKTSAGKKMDKEFILLMVQSIKDTEYLLKLAAANIKSN